jgi:hypothetical protein
VLAIGGFSNDNTSSATANIVVIYGYVYVGSFNYAYMGTLDNIPTFQNPFTSAGRNNGYDWSNITSWGSNALISPPTSSVDISISVTPKTNSYITLPVCNNCNLLNGSTISIPLSVYGNLAVKNSSFITQPIYVFGNVYFSNTSYLSTTPFIKGNIFLRNSSYIATTATAPVYFYDYSYITRAAKMLNTTTFYSNSSLQFMFNNNYLNKSYFLSGFKVVPFNTNSLSLTQMLNLPFPINI